MGRNDHALPRRFADHAPDAARVRSPTQGGRIAMSVIRFDANVPVEVALKFDGGKQVKSRIPEAPDQMMYTVCGDDTIYVPLHVADQITQLGIKRAELMSICKRQQSGVTRWEVKRISEGAEPARPEATMLENQPTRSIDQANQQKAQRAS